MSKFLIAFLSVVLFAATASASPEPCRYGTIDAKSTTVDIDAFYKAADVVVAGIVTGMEGDNLVFRVDQTFKGVADKTIVLHGQKPVNTEMNGFSLPGNKPVLLFLKPGATGVYESVEEYNSPCNIRFFVKEGKVVFVEQDEHNQAVTVELDKVKAYLEAAPQKLVYKYQ